MESIGNDSVPPDAIIECKYLRDGLDNAVPQLQSYAEAPPRMRSGVAVLTNGGGWWIYDLSMKGGFKGKLVKKVHILTGTGGLRPMSLAIGWAGRASSDFLPIVTGHFAPKS